MLWRCNPLFPLGGSEFLLVVWQTELRSMSELGQPRRFSAFLTMSGLPPTAEMKTLAGFGRNGAMSGRSNAKWRRVCARSVYIAVRSMPRPSPADAVEALLYGGEAVVDFGLELSVSENVRPVIFDTFSNQFADIEWIYALGYPLLKFFDELSDRSLRRQVFNSAGEPLRDIAPRIHNLRPNNARTQNGYPDSPRRKGRPQAFG